MTNEEIQKKLSLVKTRLGEATEENNTALINKYVGELNSLWAKASLEMIKNAKKEGWYSQDTPK